MTKTGAASGRAAGGRKQRRRAGRIVALQLLYAWDQKGADDGFLTTDEVADAAAGARDFGRGLFEGLVKELPAVDGAIAPRLNNWTVERMAVPDRCIMRLGCYELLYEADTPASVIINECIELAKLYGSEGRTTKLVNAVLDRIAKDLRPG